MTLWEWPVTAHVLSWGKRIAAVAKRGAILAARIAALESRVTELEQASAKQPADSCLDCGERAVRMTGTAGPFGEPPHQWRTEWWLCKKCGKTDERIRNF
jgi:hypothetical protein